MFVGLVALPGQPLAANITPTTAAIGEGCDASGSNSTAMGLNTTASGGASTAMGCDTTASFTYSTAMGVITTASGFASTAMGCGTIASGTYSTAMGYNTEAANWHSTVIGRGYSSTHNLINNIGSSFMVGYMADETDTAPEFFVKDGAVGIGTKSPQNLLDMGETHGKKLAVFQTTTGDDFYGFGISSGTLEIYAGADVSHDPKMVVKKTSGNVGIGTTSPSYKLHVNGTAAGTSWTNLSSKAFKEDIRKVDKSSHPILLAKLMNMELTTYKYRKEYGGDGDTRLGFIAEKMPEEVLSTDGKGVDIYELLALTIGAIKEQQRKIEELNQQIQQLKSRSFQ